MAAHVRFITAFAATGDAAPRTIIQQRCTLQRAFERLGLTVDDPARPATGQIPSPQIPGQQIPGRQIVVVEHSSLRPDISAVAIERLDEVRQVADDGAIVWIRHHDLDETSMVPADTTAWPAGPDVVHLAINLRNRRTLVAHGYENVALLPYSFDLQRQPTSPAPETALDTAPGTAPETALDTATRRATQRGALGVSDDAIVFLQPTRGSERKNVAGSLRYLQHLVRLIPAERIHFWLAGPIDPEARPLIERLLAHCPVSYTIGGVGVIDDAYAACDAVLFPSTSDRFGTPIFESIQAERPCVVGSFPVFGEIEACGIKTFSLDAPGELFKFLVKPSQRFHDVNRRRAEMSFGSAMLDANIGALLNELGIAV